MLVRTTCSLACENGIGDTADTEHYAQREKKEISLFHGDFPFCRSIRLSLLSTIVLHGMRQNKNTPICSFFIGMLLSACSIAHKFRKVNMLFSTIFMYICCILCLTPPKSKNHGRPLSILRDFSFFTVSYPFSRSAITAKASLATSTVSAMSASVRLALMKWLWWFVKNTPRRTHSAIHA